MSKGDLSSCIPPHYLTHPTCSRYFQSMIRNILVALDPDEDTLVAIDYACSIAHNHSASVTGISIVDTRRIEKRAAGGGIGSMHYAEKLKEQWTLKTREMARKLIADFQDVSAEAHIPSNYLVKEGVPAEKIVDEMRFHDILVIGNVPHFFYAHPDEQTNTLNQIVKTGVGPVIVVPKKEVVSEKVLIAFDGSAASSRSMQRFCQTKPFGEQQELHVIHVFADGEEAHSEMLLAKATNYIEDWGFTVYSASLRGDNHYTHIMQYADYIGAGVVVAGAHSVSKMAKMVFGSTTSSLVDNGEKILFIER